MRPSTRKPIARVWIDQTIVEVTRAIDDLHAGVPDADHRRLFGAINMADIFVTHNGGVWRGCDLKPVQLHDPDGCVEAAMVGVGQAWGRGAPYRCDDRTAELLRELLDALVEICEVLPHSEVQKCRNVALARTKRVTEAVMASTAP